MATELEKRIENGKMILISEMKPPKCGDPEPVRAIARKFVKKVCALGISDNRGELCMSALAASSIVAEAGVEPVLHMVTRDRNRIALVSDYLGAQSLGIRNLLVTSGTHQRLNMFNKAKNVYDIDSIQLTQALSGLSTDARFVGEKKIECTPAACIGATVDPFADPPRMQMIKLLKKIEAGAKFIITAPVFDLDRFMGWWEKIKESRIHEKAAIIAGVRVIKDAADIQEIAKKRPDPRVPGSVIERIGSISDKKRQREEGMKIALETIDALSKIEGIRGFEINSDDDYDIAISVIDRLNEKGVMNR